VAPDPTTDFSVMTDAQVIAFAKQARRDAETAREAHLAQAGRACAYLHSRGWTWERIGAEIGVNLTTAYRWARPYLDE